MVGCDAPAVPDAVFTAQHAECNEMRLRGQPPGPSSWGVGRYCGGKGLGEVRRGVVQRLSNTAKMYGLHSLC